MSKTAKEPNEVDSENAFSFLDPTQDPGKIVHASRSNQPQADLMKTALEELPKVLKHLQYDKLRAGQDRAVFTLFSQRDTICILPTGGGKSAIYIVPAMCMKWRVLIFSPLVSLMKDQVEALWKFRLPAGQISGGQTPQENQMTLLNWESGDMQFLLVAPERLESEQFLNTMTRFKPDLVVVDEAHCLSQWGDSFRPSYTRIGDFIERISPKTVLCLTATATTDVEQDIRRVLGIENAAKVIYYPARENLKTKTFKGYSDVELGRLLRKCEGSTIVYCATRKETERLFKTFGDVQGGALVYNGGMTSDERTTNQNLFMSNNVRVMFATNAFGLGVNKADIRNIIHRDCPGTVEAVAQEQGRAGRDGLESFCGLFTDQRSFETAQWMIDTTYPPEHKVKSVFWKMQQLAGPNKVFQMTIQDLAQVSGIHEKEVGSAVGILKAAKVIERIEEEENPTKVRILKKHPDEAYQRYIDLVRSVGNPREDGMVEFKMTTLLQIGKLKHTKTNEILKQLDENGYITYTRPFRGKTTKIVGDIGQVDFDRISKRRALSLVKLGKFRTSLIRLTIKSTLPAKDILGCPNEFRGGHRCGISRLRRSIRKPEMPPPVGSPPPGFVPCGRCHTLLPVESIKYHNTGVCVASDSLCWECSKLVPQPRADCVRRVSGCRGPDSAGDAPSPV
jgi:ATP-dependent DNA helicase RecQ